MSTSASIQMTSENAEELLTAATEAQATADGTAPVVPEETPEVPAETQAETPPPVEGLEIKPPAETTEEEAKADDTEAPEPVNMDDVFAEYSEQGALTEETNAKLVSALDAAGIANAQGVIDQYIAGAEASIANVRASAFEIVGGEEAYGAMSQWAAANLSPAELASYNEDVNDPSRVRLAVSGLNAQFQASGQGAPPASSPRVQAGANVGSAAEGPIPRSMVQVSELTGDPRYDKDPGFQAEANARIKRAMDLGYI